jgi:hypothetical protein
MFSPKNWWNIWPPRLFQKRDSTGVARAMPGIRAILGVIKQSPKKRRLNPFEVTFRLADDVACHELGRIFKHMDEAVQFAQDVIGYVARGLGLAVNVYRHVEILSPYLLDEMAQVQDRRIEVGSRRELFVIDGEYESTCATLLLGKLAQVTIAGDSQHFKAFGLNGLGQRAYAQSGSVFRSEIFINNDDGKSKFH